MFTPSSEAFALAVEPTGYILLFTYKTTLDIKLSSRPLSQHRKLISNEHILKTPVAK